MSSGEGLPLDCGLPWQAQGALGGHPFSRSASSTCFTGSTWAAGRGVTLLAERFGQEAELECAAEELGDVSDVEAAHQIEPVDFDGADADLQDGGDFTIGMTDGNQPKNVPLTRSERPELDFLHDRLGFATQCAFHVALTIRSRDMLTRV
ncbi:protein of unknown function [Nitrospira japonica]|uniref:Uncharacterized protein n=1 Tax=Nitrospira japonica TaxID=1325564 RepID=A0A1W1I5Q1_9BACT|nr:protein of unknown function [Nitrospira japonica]